MISNIVTITQPAFPPVELLGFSISPADASCS